MVKMDAEVTFDDVTATEAAERDALIAKLVSQMTRREKIKQMTGSTTLVGLLIMAVRYGWRTFDSGENRRLGIPPIRFTDGPRGVCLDHSTCFPVAMARGATWDVALQERVGTAVGIEARAQGANFYGGVCINVPRHPGWGRAQETFGEDPFLLGVMGASMVEGVQRHVMACAKHFACNSIDEARFFVDVKIDERTLQEVYLPHFKRCVDAEVACVMSAYNQVNGQFCGHNAHLLREILKSQWGFEGFVMSDFVYGVRDGEKGVTGGLDMEMPKRWKFGPCLLRKVKSGVVPESMLDEAVARIVGRKVAFAGVGEGGYDASKVACAVHRQLALEVARKSMVLLKNEGKALPLDAGAIERLAVIGRLADRANIGDKGSSQVKPPRVITPLEGIRELAGSSVEIVYEEGKNLDKAVSAALGAEAAVVVVGLDHRDEGEFMPAIHIGGDREDLRLPRGQEELIKAVASASDRCVVVLEGGSAILTSVWQDEVEAILMAWYPGMEGGLALAGVLFGEVNPGGKLPVTFPASNEQNPAFDKKAKTARYGYYHGYRLFDKKGMKPAFAFGFGLSYTTFECTGLRLSSASFDVNGTLEASVDVTNTGKLEGDEVVQLYVSPPGIVVDRPVKELKAFARVTLEPDETKTVSLTVPIMDLSYYDVDAGAFVVEKGEHRVLVGPSSDDLPLSATFAVT
jgi:beta-glucosidase